LNQTTFENFELINSPQKVVKVKPQKPVIEIYVEAYWEKRDSSFIENPDWKYQTDFHGGWVITKCKGHPEINGGHGTPDFNENEESIKKMFVDRYSERFPDNFIKVILTVTKDER
jgi:hypothetical protein